MNMPQTVEELIYEWIDDSTKVCIVSNGIYITSGNWYQDNILKYMEEKIKSITFSENYACIDVEIENKIEEPEYFHNGGGFYVSAAPYKNEEGKELILMISDDNINEFIIYNNISDDYDVIMENKNIVQDGNILHSHVSKEAKEAYLIAVKKILEDK